MNTFLPNANSALRTALHVSLAIYPAAQQSVPAIDDLQERISVHERRGPEWAPMTKFVAANSIFRV